MGLESGVIESESDNQQVLELIGNEKVKEYLDELNYGNTDISGGLDQFWQNSSLKISAIEQVEILKRLYAYELPFSHDHINSIKKAKTLSKENNGELFELFHVEKNKSVWYTGYFEQSSNVYIFASFNEGKNITDEQTVREIAGKILEDKARKRRIEKGVV